LPPTHRTLSSVFRISDSAAEAGFRKVRWPIEIQRRPDFARSTGVQPCAGISIKP